METIGHCGGGGGGGGDEPDGEAIAMALKEAAKKGTVGRHCAIIPGLRPPGMPPMFSASPAPPAVEEQRPKAFSKSRPSRPDNQADVDVKEEVDDEDLYEGYQRTPDGIDMVKINGQWWCMSGFSV